MCHTIAKRMPNSLELIYIGFDKYEISVQSEMDFHVALRYMEVQKTISLIV